MNHNFFLDLGYLEPPLFKTLILRRSRVVDNLLGMWRFKIRNFVILICLKIKIKINKSTF